MSAPNVGVVMHGIDDLRLDELPAVEPAEHEVQLAVKTVGICGSDVSYLKKGRIGNYVVTAPLVLGHETGAVVTKCGRSVTHLQPGDRVAVEPGVPCRRCHQCLRGTYNLCARVQFCATPPVHGTLCASYVHAADFCHRLPATVTLEEAALVEPLAVAVHACKRARLQPGDTVLVCGAGPIGLLCLLVARAMGATRTLVTDINSGRLDTAHAHTGTCTLDVSGLAAAECARRVMERLGGDRARVTIECTGAESCVQTALLCTESGGTVVLVGMGAPTVTVPLLEAGLREVDIRGVFRYANCYPAAINLIESGRVQVGWMVSHRYALREFEEAFDTAYKCPPGTVKVMFQL